LRIALTVFRELVEQAAAGAEIFIVGKGTKAGNGPWRYSPHRPIDFEELGVPIPPVAADGGGRRRTFVFEGEAADALKELRERTRFQQDREVLEAALNVYRDVLWLDAQGLVFEVHHGDGDVWRYLPHAPLGRSPFRPIAMAATGNRKVHPA
jgi:hypothetical protein